MACRWAEDEDGNWWTACDEGHEFIEGGPDENGYGWCPYCGERLESASYQPAETDE